MTVSPIKKFDMQSPRNIEEWEIHPDHSLWKKNKMNIKNSTTTTKNNNMHTSVGKRGICA